MFQPKNHFVWIGLNAADGGGNTLLLVDTDDEVSAKGIGEARYVLEEFLLLVISFGVEITLVLKLKAFRDRKVQELSQVTFGEVVESSRSMDIVILVG